MTTVDLRERERATATPAVAPLLEVRSLEVVYNRAVTAIQGVSLKVAPGSITGIVGTNGAGKTTTMKAIAGFLSADDVEVTEGSILFHGKPIERKPPHRVARAGIALVPERDKIFSRLTIEENLRASVTKVSDESRRAMRLEDVYELFPLLYERRRSTAGYLSGGERQMLAIAMGLLGSPELVLIDELSLGLSPAASNQLAQLVVDLRRDHGLSFLVVEQNALLAVEIVDYAYVMENGRIVFEGATDSLVAHADFREFYLGFGGETEGKAKTYRDVREYRRKRRWFA